MQECHILTTANVADEISAELSELGAAAVTWQDAGDQPIYEPKPNEELHWDEIKLVALFEEDTLSADVHQYLADRSQQQLIKSFAITEVEQKDWIRASLDLFVPTKFGDNFWVCPTWHTPVDSNAINMMFDPGLAFGTGSHPTTALCLEWLATHIKGNETIVDYGCGSGILAVSALLLGAKKALAVDYDPQALTATEMNANINHIAPGKITIVLPEHVNAIQADIVIANIIAKPLIELASTIADLTKANGRLVLSGILEDQVEDVLNTYQTWFHLHEKTSKEGWMRLELKKTA